MTAKWGLLTRHALVVVHLVEHPKSTVREIAEAAGVTERGATTLLRAMEADGVITRRKEGRSLAYAVDIPTLVSFRSYGRYSAEEIARGLLNIVERTRGAALELATSPTAAAEVVSVELSTVAQP